MKLKITTLVAITLLISYTGIAQISAGSILIGGTAQFQNSEITDNQAIQFVPNVQYFISDHISIGGRLGFTTQRNNLGDDAYDRTNSVVIGPEARYYFGMGEHIYFYGAASIGFGLGGTTEIDGNNRTDLDDRSTFNFKINPGILFSPSPKIGFNFELNLISVNRYSVTPAGGNTTFVSNDVALGPNTFAPTFGIYYILGN